jgi:hypothetical protein
MPIEAGAVGKEQCVLCRRLELGQCTAMRAELLEIPPCERVCDQCLQAWAGNVGFGCLIVGPTQH